MSVRGWKELGPFEISATEIEEAMRQEFWDRHARVQESSDVTEVVVEWQEGEHGQPEIAAGWPNCGVKQLPGSARDVFWLALEILQHKIDLPQGVYPDDVRSSVNEKNLVQLMVHVECDEDEENMQ